MVAGGAAVVVIGGAAVTGAFLSLHERADAVNKKLRLHVSPTLFLQLMPNETVNLLRSFKAILAVRPARLIGKYFEFLFFAHCCSVKHASQATSERS